MCDNCKDIILRDSFYGLDDYMNCLEYIQELIRSGECSLIKSTCELDKVKDSGGNWNSDIIEHTIQCEKCGKLFICFSDTYHGNGSFKEQGE